MKSNRERAKELLPAIILTILSMIQALALELYWSKLVDSPYLWHGDVHAVIGWLQFAVMLQGMLLIWVFFVSFVLRFSWLPSVEDTLMPFAIGLLQFALVDLMDPSTLWLWFLFLAAIFGVSTFASYLMMRQARHDPDNNYFFSRVQPAGWRDYFSTLLILFALCSLGLLIWWTDNNPALSIAALLFALGALAYRILMVRRFWMHSIDSTEPRGGN
ncbi:MAG: hypothetical protein AAF699_03190 [Pseudomonadota bacterium]